MSKKRVFLSAVFFVSVMLFVVISSIKLAQAEADMEMIRCNCKLDNPERFGIIQEWVCQIRNDCGPTE
jgi:hypothetical protein